MQVNPVYAAVGTIFQNQPLLRVPKYQRGYAWEKEEIDDFLNDLEKVYLGRKAGKPQNHFLGGIVSVQRPIIGTVQKFEYELVDGQQRIATFVLLANAIILNYQKIVAQAEKNGDTNNLSITNKRIDKLIPRYLQFEQETNRNIAIENVLKLSKTDDTFFSALIHSSNPQADRDSHKRLKYAFDKINKKVEILTESQDINVYLDNLEILEQNIDDDFTILHIVTQDKKEAYTLFQVLNDRGKNLTEGDLLRAKTLELLEGHPPQQDSVESYWDKILSDPPRETEDFLRAIYASYKEDRPGQNTLFDDFLGYFYPQQTKTTITVQDADEIFLQTQKIQHEVANSRKLVKGEWVFPIQQPVESWDRNRLSLLVNELKTSTFLPILLAGCNLDHKTFAEMVNILERFHFRYVIICKQHHSDILKIVHAESGEIRKNPSGYTLNSLKNKLQDLLDKKANDTFFKSSLDSLMYSSNGGSNKPVKYFLITLEDYLRWYRNGAVGEPVCSDKSRVFMFADTTIEHIYPKNASSSVLDLNMEDLKQTIGNLTILGANDNQTIGNDDFLAKRPIFAQSSAILTQELAQKTQWSRNEILTRTAELKEIATKVFKVK
jgi:hypothetical protein